MGRITKIQEMEHAKRNRNRFKMQGMRQPKVSREPNLGLAVPDVAAHPPSRSGILGFLRHWLRWLLKG